MISRLCTLAFVMTLLVVTLGALTRLLDAGLGCPDWPGCYGQLMPPNNEHYAGGDVVDKGKAWMEMVHRYLAASLGLIILILAVKIETDKGLTAKVKWLSRSALLLVIAQGLLGMLTVTMQLLPQVVTLHLLGGMGLLALLFLLILKFQSLSSVPTATGLKPLALTVFVLLFCQITLGGWTSSNYAGMACPDFPKCQNQWWPDMALGEAFNIAEVSELNYEGGVLTSQARITIQHVHRVFALLLLLSIIVLFIRLWSLPHLRLPALFMLGITVLQISLGIANVLWFLPLPLALAHNTGAALLLLSVVYINYVSFAKVVINDYGYNQIPVNG